METIFSKIIKGDIPSYKVAEDDNYYAFLDIHPLAKGHTLVIPKLEIDNIFDLPDDIYQGLFMFANKVAKSIQLNFPCLKVGIAVIGIEVPHAHIHLVPINSVGDLDFKNPKVKLSAEEFLEIAEKIRLSIQK